MSILATDSSSRTMAKIGFGYLWISLFCACFGAIYEYFSHDVYSGFMIYAFMYPLVGGTLPFYALALRRDSFRPGRISINLYNSGIATLTVGSIFQGVLEIYGTTNRLVWVYWLVGAGFCALGLLTFLLKPHKTSTFSEQEKILS